MQRNGPGGRCRKVGEFNMKSVCLSIGLVAFSAAICAAQTEPCAGLEGTDLRQCRSNQQTLRQQERLEQEIQQQQERQNQLDKQQREVQQQLESMRLQNESLRKQLERQAASQPARLEATHSTDVSKTEDLRNWRADNPWYGSDYPRTQFATRYITQLHKERPDLAGRELLDAVSIKVNETFAAKH
jgi:TolA-binding protein